MRALQSGWQGEQLYKPLQLITTVCVSMTGQAEAPEAVARPEVMRAGVESPPPPVEELSAGHLSTMNTCHLPASLTCWLRQC